MKQFLHILNEKMDFIGVYNRAKYGTKEKKGIYSSKKFNFNFNFLKENKRLNPKLSFTLWLKILLKYLNDWKQFELRNLMLQ